MRRKLGLITILVGVFLATVSVVYLLQKDEAQAINVFGQTSKSGSESSSGSPGFDKIWSFNQAEADKWTRKADMPTARSGLAASEVNGKIYAIGGAAPGVSLSTMEEYDPAADTWTKKADMPTRRWGLATAAVNGKIYAIGGVDERDVSMSTVEEYDPVADKWNRKADMLFASSAPAAVGVNGKIYVIGGKNPVAGVLSTVQEYNPVANKWTEKAKMPTARHRLSASVVNGKIYAIGGARVQGQGVPTLEEYDPVTDTWTKKADMSIFFVVGGRFGRETLAASAVGGKIYAIGGAIPPFVSVSTVEEYDPATDTWTKKTDMLTARRWLATGAVGGKIYAIGGQGVAANLSTVEEYDTGFVPPQRVEAKGKLPISWGKIKAKY
jgi:N-acetylneuraminic acid mutarotase